jgi:YrbI family 3-deoxy-D-manno-octulosonate 8-phosphate phosphatase
VSDSPDTVTLRRTPRVVAVIPARGGSQGVPLKNLEPVGGRPLVVRAVESCRSSRLVSEVVVSTDHPSIAEAARRAGARVIIRPATISGDTATSESAVLHALDEMAADGLPAEVAILVQCTSPFIDPADLDSAIAQVLADEADVVFSAVESHAFLWTYRGPVLGGVNHDPSFRQRRQDREPEYRETGAFYVMRARGLREANGRFFGRLAAQRVPEPHAVEIDTPGDLRLAQMLALVVDNLPPVDVDAIVTDFDGVHTDDSVFVTQDGSEGVMVSREDGMGVSLARRAGIRFLILSTETNPVVSARAAKLKVPVLQGQGDKAAALREWMAAEGLDPTRVAYLGNDVNDLGCLGLVGWPVAVANAHPDVRSAARLQLRRRGGAGAVRELCELVVEAAGRRPLNGAVDPNLVGVSPLS